MWRVPGERIKLDLDGPTVEVERLTSWFVQFECLQLMGAFLTAKSPPAEHSALSVLFDRVAIEAQPTWDIVDHRGAVPNTARGLARLPLNLALAITSQWLDTLVAARPESPESSEPLSAVDAVIPPGPANREIKRRLRSVKAA